ncbi:MAG: PF20097 family protein [Lentihominibacter sp.]|jgi:hypothetical protein
MNCPYCGKEMEEGYLQAARGIFFGKKKHKISFLPGQEDVKVAQDTGMGAFARSYYCGDCEIIITSMGERQEV